MAHSTSGQSEPPAPVAKPATGLQNLPSGYGITPADQVAMGKAAASARATGKPVAVASMTDPTTEIVASPMGGFSLEANAQPVRTEQHGAWVPIDTTLQRTAGARSHRKPPPTAVSSSPTAALPRWP